MEEPDTRVSVLNSFDSTRLSYELRKSSTVRLLRPHSTPATLLWLEENYEMAEGVCIPRNAVYLQYADFSAKNSMQPVNPASFGKIMRQQFPQLTTRRLGTRGQSRYHYYGIAIRETSQYYQPSYSKRSTANSDSRREVVPRQISLCSPKTRLISVLPEFPQLCDLNLPPSCDVEKLNTFLVMYRTHSQRILDTVVRASFDEVQNFLLHFWQGVPPHLAPLLGSNALVNLVGVCDSVLYKGISNIILPSILQAFPDSLTKAIQHFVQELDCWLKMALYNLPENLRNVKLEMARRFGQLLRRRMSLNHLAQASRLVVRNGDIAGQMLQDWRLVDATAVARETLFSTTELGRQYPAGHSRTGSGTRTVEFVLEACQEFESLLENDSTLDSYIEWLDSLVRKCVLAPCVRRRRPIRDQARQFLLIWSAFGTRVIRDMTLHSAASFGSFHLLRLMFDDYVLYLVENAYLEDQVKEFLENIANDLPPNLSLNGDYDQDDLPIGQATPYNQPGVLPADQVYVTELVTSSTRSGQPGLLESPLVTCQRSLPRPSDEEDEEDDEGPLGHGAGTPGPTLHVNSSASPSNMAGSGRHDIVLMDRRTSVEAPIPSGIPEEDVMNALVTNSGSSAKVVQGEEALAVQAHVWNGEYYQNYGSVELQCLRSGRPEGWTVSSPSSPASNTSAVVFRTRSSASSVGTRNGQQGIYIHQLAEQFGCTENGNEDDAGSLRQVLCDNGFECESNYCEGRHFDVTTTSNPYPAYPVTFSKPPAVAPGVHFERNYNGPHRQTQTVDVFQQASFAQG